MTTEQKAASHPITASQSAWFDREVGWIRSNSRRAIWGAAGLLVLLAAYLGIVAKFATGPINVFHNDALWMLDNGWRVLNGQVPHRDFYTPLGAFEYWILAWGMLLAHESARGLAIGTSFFGAMVGVWAWLLCRRRLAPLPALLITAWLVFTATCPAPLGFGPEFLSCAMIHNRQSYALLGIILVECAFARSRARFGGGASSGIALVLLGFLKLNFFGMAGLMLLASVPLQRREISRLGGLLAGSAAASLSMAASLRFSLGAFLDDMSFVLHAHAPLTLSATFAGAITCAKSGSVWLVILMMLGLIAFRSPAERWNRETVTHLFLGCLVLASGPLFLQTNSLENKCTLAGLWIIILLDQVTAIHLRVPDKQKQFTVALIALGLGGIAVDLIPNLATAANLVNYQSAAIKSEGLRIDAPGMEDVRFYNSTSFYDKMKTGDGDGTYYVGVLDDGLALLRAQSRPEESVFVLGFSNPFSYLLRRKPAHGGSSFLFIPTSITQNHMPAVDRVFGDADLMMLPEYESTHHDGDQFIQNYYRSYLLQNFRFVAKSKDWSLYRRNNPVR